jgi:hypothetical protein
MIKFLTNLYRLFQCIAVLVCLGLAGILISCDGNLFESISDDDSYEARLEEGLMALDDEDYDKAVELFLDLRSDYSSKEEVCVYLSNAYAGLTGIDTFNLLETIDELNDTEDEGSIDMIGLLLGDATGVIQLLEVTDKMDLLSLAKSAIDNCIDNPDTDERVQSGLLGLGDAALIIANLVLTDLGLDSVELTEEGLDALYDTTPEIDQTDISDAMLQQLNDSLDDIADAVDALEELLGADEENDLSESFEEFLADVDPGGDGIDRNDLEQYIQNL